jgi:hypothetical protein
VKVLRSHPGAPGIESDGETSCARRECHKGRCAKFCRAVQSGINEIDDSLGKATQKPELYFGLVAPVGSDLSRVTEDLQEALTGVAYRCQTLHLIEHIHELEPWNEIPESPLDVRIDKHMDAGNELRHQATRGDAIALLGVGAVRKFRGMSYSGRELPLTEKVQIPVPNTAYVFRSLKHPGAIETRPGDTQEPRSYWRIEIGTCRLVPHTGT